jgi:hypothetical protein
MGMMTNRFRTPSGSPGIIVPALRLLRAPIGAAFAGRSAPISLLVRDRGPGT